MRRALLIAGLVALAVPATASAHATLRSTTPHFGTELQSSPRTIRLHFDLESDASEEDLAALIETTERYCVVFQTLAQSPALSISRS